MGNILPNTAILKSPSNWFLVAFAAILLGFVFHVFNKDEM